MTNYTKKFGFMAFHTKLCLVQNHCSSDFFEGDGFIRVYDGNRYLILFGSEKYDAIYDRIGNLVSQKRGITYVFPHD